MSINISYQPSAAAVGSAALVGGEGDYLKWLNQMRQQQYQFGVNTQLQQAQMQLSRMNALSQIAADAQRQQSQQQFQAAQMPQQAALQAQGQAFQSALGNQSDMQKQMLGAGIDRQQAADRFGYQQELSYQNADQQAQVANAQQQAELERQTGLADYNANIKEGQQWQQTWNNPFQSSQKNVEQAQQQGYQFSPADDQKRKGIINDIQAIQQQVSGGQLTYGDALPSFKQKYSQLNSIVPTDKPQTTDEVIQQKVAFGYKMPDGSIKPGTEDIPFTVDPKGNVQVVRGWKVDQGGQDELAPDGSLLGEKTRGQTLKNQIGEREVALHRFKYAKAAVDSAVKQAQATFQTIDVNAVRQNALAEYDAATQQTPSGPTPVGPGQQPGGNPAPQAQSPQPGIPAPQPQQQAPVAQQPQPQPQQAAQPPSAQQALQQQPDAALPAIRAAAQQQQVYSPQEAHVSQTLAQSPKDVQQIAQMGLQIPPQYQRDAAAVHLAGMAVQLMNAYGPQLMNNDVTLRAWSEVVGQIQDNYPEMMPAMQALADARMNQPKQQGA